MRFREHAAPIVLVLATTFLSLPCACRADTDSPRPALSTGDEDAGVGEPLSCLDCLGRGQKISLPFVRIAFLQTGMLVGAGALWPEGYSPVRVRVNLHQFKKSWTEPPEFHFSKNIFESDNDWWYFNVFAHGLFGSEGYLAGRGLGHGPAASFGYALFASFTWEYLVEGFFKQPSAIDLFWTPASGALLGELRFQAHRLVARRVRPRAVRLALLILLDPLGELQRLMLGSGQ